MKAPLPSATANWHNDTYDAISPTRPELSAAGKTVVVTGAGSGIGRETALAFAEAGASRLVLIGRTESTLAETAKLLPQATTHTTHALNITDASALSAAAKATGSWDVLVLSAGHVSTPGTIAETSADEWWQCFETNVKGTMLAVQAFAPTANPKGASLLGVVTGTTALPTAMVPGLSAYMGAKLAQTKVLEFVAAEHPQIFVASVHPGMVETSIFTKSGAKKEALPMDSVKLPAHFMVWLASPEGAFLKGRSVWANWDVAELQSQTADIQGGMSMTSGINGWPFSNSG